MWIRGTPLASRKKFHPPQRTSQSIRCTKGDRVYYVKFRRLYACFMEWYHSLIADLLDLSVQFDWSSVIFIKPVEIRIYSQYNYFLLWRISNAEYFSVIVGYILHKIYIFQYCLWEFNFLNSRLRNTFMHAQPKLVSWNVIQTLVFWKVLALRFKPLEMKGPKSKQKFNSFISFSICMLKREDCHQASAITENPQSCC